MVCYHVVHATSAQVHSLSSTNLAMDGKGFHDFAPVSKYFISVGTKSSFHRASRTYPSLSHLPGKIATTTWNNDEQHKSIELVKETEFKRKGMKF